MAGLPKVLRVDEVLHAPYLGDGSAGSTFGPEGVIRGYVEDAPRTVRAADGRDVVAGATAYLDLDPAVAPEDRLTIAGRPRRVLAVKRHEFSAATPNHQEVSVE